MDPHYLFFVMCNFEQACDVPIEVGKLDLQPSSDSPPLSSSCKESVIRGKFRHASDSINDEKEDLLQEKLMLVGTILKNKRELPPEIVEVKNREEYSSLFLFRKNMTLVSYVPKKERNVLLISSMHKEIAIDASTDEKQKPEIITFYNSTKCGVDTEDEVCETYSVERNTRRWPVAVFYHLLNTSGINAFIIYRSIHPDMKINSRTFLRDIAKGLTKPFIKESFSTVTHSVSESLMYCSLEVSCSDSSAEASEISLCQNFTAPHLKVHQKAEQPFLCPSQNINHSSKGPAQQPRNTAKMAFLKYKLSVGKEEGAKFEEKFSYGFWRNT
ncbi:hypothetical protein J437_LFUL016649 [Ladona fulva]|uniref:PiggyBac transposable element-derived protein domain-containing protein n=1 Tax=Ladona fulva TaxID=123851 RepID=A0A8K0KMT8_LADFU|nr:hypothetical protein J437_LFUL016649 [Ladona fulva]